VRSSAITLIPNQTLILITFYKNENVFSADLLSASFELHLKDILII